MRAPVCLGLLIHKKGRCASPRLS